MPWAKDELFWKKVKKTNSCWEWTGAKQQFGNLFYGWLTRKNKQYLAHRWSWIIENGPIEKGLCVPHKCDNPICINPNHLFLGTQKDNVIDMLSKGRGCNGSNHKNSKLTEDDVRDLREMCENKKVSINQAARDFGINYKTAWNIVQRLKWKHVQLELNVFLSLAEMRKSLGIQRGILTF